MLELALDPGAIPRLVAVPGLRRSGRAQPLLIEWFDTADGSLLRDGWVVRRVGASWQVVRDGDPWATPPLFAESRDRSGIGSLAEGAEVRESWTGTRHVFRFSGAQGVVRLVVLDGRFKRRTGRRAGRLPPCRLCLDGPGPAVGALAAQLARAGAFVPTTTLARQALMAPDPAPRPLPPPDPEGAAGPAAAGLLAGQLRLMQDWAARVPGATTPEPVHQMRVATRRLRALLSTFRKALPSPELALLGPAVKDCAARLGAARDWDVFLQGAGTRLAAAFPEDARCAAMLRSAERRRKTVHRALRAYLAGADFRVLMAGLAHAAAERPWVEEPGTVLRAVAEERLRGRWKRVRRRAKGLDTLPVEALHELRKDCKRLRYTAEFFAFLFPHKATKRFLRPLAALQEELGLLNDGAAIGGLMAQLGRADRGYAAGLAEGYTAAGAGPARGRIGKAWKRLHKAGPFWPPSSKGGKALDSRDAD